MVLADHKHEISIIGMCVRNHTKLAHQPVVHITKHLNDSEWCAPHTHHIPIHFCTLTHEDDTNAQDPQV